ncbi:DNA cytosine methyltransferase [Candidatus Woesearchaeota archaeon]|nr:DNA cytosine methyltransferase [Candidatus Woesearchaeota archaeon]
MKIKNKKLTFIDLFCGAGGLSLGFENNGFELILANDNDRHSIETFKKNHPSLKTDSIILDDIRNLSGYFDKLGVKKNSVDLIIGGPPCQGFSMANRQRLIDDPRNYLYKEFVKAVFNLQPRAFLMENVKGMLPVAKQIVEDFEKGGYAVSYQIVNAKNYGVPQNRERLIYLGLREKSFKNPKEILTTIFRHIDIKKQPNEIPISSAFWGLRKLVARSEKNNTEIDSKKSGLFKDKIFLNDRGDRSYVKKINSGRIPSSIYNHKARYNNDRDLLIFKLLPQGGRSDHPDIAHIMPYNNRKGIFKDKFYKLIHGKPSKTITSHMKFDCHMYIHPNEARGLTPREAARIQGFPDDYVFYGPYTQWYNQIGNAVPPPLSNIIAGVLRKHLS